MHIKLTNFEAALNPDCILLKEYGRKKRPYFQKVCLKQLVNLQKPVNG